MRQDRGLGWLPDVPKPNDYTDQTPTVAALLERTELAPRIGAVAKAQPGKRMAAAAPLPEAVDLRAWFSPVESQGSLGSCTANAAVALLEYFERRASGRHIDASQLFLYKVERNLLGWTGDTGAYLRTAMQALVLFGVPPERYWPYDGTEWALNMRYEVEPPAFCYAFGANYQAIKYFRHDPPGASPETVLKNVKTYLAAGFPSMFGFPTYIEYDEPQPGGLIAYPSPTSKFLGGHANVAAGYDDTIEIGDDVGALLVRNSWGESWGNDGYAWMTYRYVTEGLANDWWSMTSSEWVDTGQF